MLQRSMGECCNGVLGCGRDLQWGVGVWMSVSMGCWGMDECFNGVLGCR